MDTSVYEFSYRGVVEPLVDIYGPFARLRWSEASVAAALVAAALLVRVVAREASRRPPDVIDRIAQAAPWVMLVAMYCQTWGQIDEVAIGLEHPYNLFHHGRFSFSPTRMLDGTVECVYFLLLTPFAWSPASVVGANFGLGLLVALSHLWILARILKGEPSAVRLSLLLLFSVNYPIVALLSNGFGNSLVSLLFLRSMQLMLEGRTRSALVTGSLLPLLRPDAILYSYSLLFAMRFGRGVRFDRRLVAEWLLPVCALGVYFVAFRMAYGHWVPTPIAFKSVYPSMITLDGLKVFAVLAMSGLTQPTHLLALLALVASYGFRDDRLVLVRRVLLPAAAIYLFYSLTRGVYGDFSGDTYSRYWIGFEQALWLCLMLVIARGVQALETSGLWRERHIVVGRVVPVAVIAIVASAIVWDGARGDRTRSTLGHAGQIVARIIPPDFSLATSELNAFGLSIPNHEVIDLWGYTNPAIASSRMLHGYRARSNPEFFLAARPDLYFAFRELADTRDAEHYLATFGHAARRVNLLGDMEAVLDHYDLVVLRHPQRGVALLVRRDRVEPLRRSLERHAYVASVARPFDRDKFTADYRLEPLVQYRY